MHGIRLTGGLLRLMAQADRLGAEVGSHLVPCSVTFIALTTL